MDKGPTVPNCANKLTKIKRILPGQKYFSNLSFLGKRLIPEIFQRFQLFHTNLVGEIKN